MFGILLPSMMSESWDFEMPDFLVKARIERFCEVNKEKSGILRFPIFGLSERLKLAASTTPAAPCEFFASFLVRIVRFCKP